MPYGKAAFGQGITLDDYRKEFRQHGERIRHDRALVGMPLDARGPNGEVPDGNGTLYIENPLPEGVRVLISQTESDITDSEWGIFKAGSTSIACCLDELELARLDRVTLLDRQVFARQSFKPSGAASDELNRPFVSALVSVLAGTGALVTDAFGNSSIEWEEQPTEGAGTLVTDAFGNSSILWNGEPPEKCTIELRYHPRYIWLAIGDKYPPIGADGKPLPQRGILTLENRKPNVNINF